MEYFSDWHNMYYKNTDGDDYWEGIEFLWNNRNDIPDSLWEEAYEIYSIADTSGSE